MAENEVLDVGNPRRFRRWRAALADASVAPSQVADCLADDFLSVLRGKLRRKPLYLVLKACQSDRKALEEVIEKFKDRALAKMVERAHRIVESADPQAVAHKITELMLDTLIDRASLFSSRYAPDVADERRNSLAQATLERLNACKSEVLSLLTASLRDEPIGRLLGKRSKRSSAKSVLSISLQGSGAKPTPGHTRG